MISKNKNIFPLLFFKKNIYIIFSALKGAGLLKALHYAMTDIHRYYQSIVLCVLINISPMMARGAYGECSRIYPKGYKSQLVMMIFRLSDRFLSGLFSLTSTQGK